MNKQADRILLLIVLFVTMLLIGTDGTMVNASVNQTQSTNANKQQKQTAPQLPSPTKTATQENAKPVEAAPVTTDTSSASTDATNQTPTMQETTPATPAPPRRKGRRQSRTASSETTAAATATAQTEQADLSGTYAGVMNCPDAGVTGDTTLTVTGNQFTLANGPSGRILASTTHGYTAVAMQFGEAPTATAGQTLPPPPKIISFRARKSGDRLTLTPVSAGTQCSFMPSSMARSRRTRGNRRATQTTATGEATSSPVAAPTVVEPTAGPMPEPTTPRRGRTRSKRNVNANTNVNANRNMTTNENTGAGNTNANSNTNVSPSPSPTPGPRQQ